MVEIKTSWTEENLSEYYKYTIFSSKKLPKILLAVLPIMYLAIVAYCLAVFIRMKYTLTLVFALVMTLIFAVSVIIFFSMTKSIIRNALKANEDSDFNRAMVDKDAIILLKDEKPLGELEWDKIKTISLNEKFSAVYLSTDEDALLILESKNIINGSWDSLKEIVREKNDKLSKKA
ncbi:MAG: hypothetical protein NC203_10595 [Firmicutes bacterium]|nr:hypothetical protein [Bacillota bacterium]